MLQANKAQLLTQLNLDTLNIRQSELHYWNSSFSKFASLGALLAGFASQCFLLSIQDIQIPSKSSHSNFKNPDSSLVDVETLPHLLYILSTISAFGCNLLLLTVCTVCCMFAPTCALQGLGEESINRSVRLFESRFPLVLQLFEYGLISYFVSGCMVILHFYRVIEALVLFPFLVAFLMLLKRHIIKLRLSFIARTMKSGRMHSVVVHDVGSLVTRESLFGQPRDPSLESQQFSTSFANTI